MLLSLNEYCLEAICDHLNLTDLLTLSRVCQHLQEIVKNKCRRGSEENSIITKHWRKVENLYQMPYFLKLLLETKNGAIECNTAELYQNRAAFENLQFEKVETLTISVKNINTEQSNDLYELIISLFPCMSKLIVSDNFPTETRCITWSFSYIKIEICATPTIGVWDLIGNSECESIIFHECLDDKDYIKKLTSSWDLKALTLKKVDYDGIGEHIGFKHLIELRNLTISTTDAGADFNLTVDGNYFYRLIDSISFNLISKEQRNNLRLKGNFTELRRLTFINDDGTVLQQCCKLDPKNFKLLEEIYYLSDWDDKNSNKQQENLLKMVQICTELRVLDISGSICFEDNFVESLKAIVKGRKQRLLLRCYNSCNCFVQDIESAELIISDQRVHQELPEENEICIQLGNDRDLKEQSDFLKGLLEKYQNEHYGMHQCLELVQFVEQYYEEIKENLYHDYYEDEDEDEPSLENLAYLRYQIKCGTRNVLMEFWSDQFY